MSSNTDIWQNYTGMPIDRVVAGESYGGVSFEEEPVEPSIILGSSLLRDNFTDLATSDKKILFSYGDVESSSIDTLLSPRLQDYALENLNASIFRLLLSRMADAWSQNLEFGSRVYRLLERNSYPLISFSQSKCVPERSAPGKTISLSEARRKSLEVLRNSKQALTEERTVEACFLLRSTEDRLT